MGHVDADLSSLGYQNECRQTAQLTEKSVLFFLKKFTKCVLIRIGTSTVWKRIRPLLEPGVQENKRLRLERHMEALQMQRKQILNACYLEYQRSLPPSQWKYMPAALEIVHYEPFAELIKANIDVNVTASMFDDAFKGIPEHHAAAMEKQRAALRLLLPNCVDEREEGEVGETVSDPLDLATAVFQCQTKGAPHHLSFVFGWDDITAHHCLMERSGWPLCLTNSTSIGSPTTPQLEYGVHAAKVVEKLVRLSGLDPMNATAADLDQKNLRFFCPVCEPLKAGVEASKYIWRLGYTWRTIVRSPFVRSYKPTNNLFFIGRAPRKSGGWA